MVTDGIGSLVIFECKMAISTINTLLAFSIIDNNENLTEIIDFPIVILILIFIMSWILAGTFMSAYQVISLAIL